MDIQLNDRGFFVDGQTTPLVAGQFEPFRHNPMYWRRCLRAMKRAGLDLVSIFTCWDFHELSPGDFDFTGKTNPSRDLAGFLDLCQEEGLLVMLRPGPIIDDEWETRGPAPDVNKLDRLHPRFLERTNQYIRAIAEVCVPRQATRGGPVALLGVDNEMLFPYCTPPEQFAVDGDAYVPYDEAYVSGEFRAWLEEQYRELASLNEALRTSFRTWEEVRPPRFQEDPLAYSLEAFRFINHRIQTWARVCTRMYREAGFEIPTYTNMKQLLGYIDWPAIAGEMDYVGTNLHLPNDMKGEIALVANWWYRLHAARFPFSWAAEFQAGWIGLDEEFGFISPRHCEYMPMAAQAAGLRGLSFFMFIERDDWNYSPVNLFGKIRPNRYERFVRAIRSYRGLASDDAQKADIGLIWSLEAHQARYLGANRDWSTLTQHWMRCDEPKELPAFWEVYRRLCDWDVDFRFWIPGVTKGEMPGVLVYAGPPFAGEGMAAFLKEIAASNCWLIALTPLPTLDLAGRPSPGLVEASRMAMQRERSVRGRPEDLPSLLSLAGARAYARSGKAGVWTYVYEDAQGALVLGIWNSNAEPYEGPVQLAGELLGEGSWLVQEPRLETAETRKAEQLLAFPVSLEPHSARVFRMARVREDGSARP